MYAELLSKESFDVVIVDHDAAQLEGPKNTLDVLTIHANGASPITMNEPDIRGADILIADTALANEELGWKAERSVDETLESAWAWEKHLAGKE